MTNTHQLFTDLASIDPKEWEQKSTFPLTNYLTESDPPLAICLLEFCNLDKHMWARQRLISTVQFTHKFVVSNVTQSNKLSNQVVLNVNQDGTLKVLECRVAFSMSKGEVEIFDRTDSSFSSSCISSINLYTFCHLVGIKAHQVVLCGFNLNEESFWEEIAMDNELTKLFSDFLHCDKAVGLFPLIMLLNLNSFVNFIENDEIVRKRFKTQCCKLSDSEFIDLKQYVNSHNLFSDKILFQFFE